MRGLHTSPLYLQINTQRILMISENLKGFAFRQNELNLKETRFAVYINAVHFSTTVVISKRDSGFLELYSGYQSSGFRTL